VTVNRRIAAVIISRSPHCVYVGVKRWQERALRKGGAAFLYRLGQSKNMPCSDVVAKRIWALNTQKSSKVARTRRLLMLFSTAKARQELASQTVATATNRRSQPPPGETWRLSRRTPPSGRDRWRAGAGVEGGGAGGAVGEVGRQRGAERGAGEGEQVEGHQRHAVEVGVGDDGGPDPDRPAGGAGEQPDEGRDLDQERQELHRDVEGEPGPRAGPGLQGGLGGDRHRHGDDEEQGGLASRVRAVVAEAGTEAGLAPRRRKTPR
jgi:hypothetical protein